MSLLRAEPPGPVKSLQELFAIASAMEQEAAVRYAEIANRMRRDGQPSLADVFERLSVDERGHLDNVIEWSQKTKGEFPDPARIRWQMPETFDDEGIATTDPRLLGAYRVLSMAVRNEERAFAFWSYVAAHAEETEIRQAAEKMAHEELEHVSILRRERRKAFHGERRQLGTDPEGDNIGKGLATLERTLAELLETLAGEAPDVESSRLRDFASEARRHADELTRLPIFIDRAISLRQISNDPLVIAELLADRYLEAGDILRDEKDMERAQALAGHAIARLAWLRSDLPELQRP
ncbi:ferritin family protein [Microvirga rosea]|uniref:ferritin family protein n=1 Tax=Microvirga rosea TaxID=2715425 RepID=UPI001D09F6C5|nr:ferritin family protein [Microvirga rosea]MCB8820564.1 rubrerythrin family protein [Microvirga rosea]